MGGMVGGGMVAGDMVDVGRTRRCEGVLVRLSRFPPRTERGAQAARPALATGVRGVDA
jgi:hypothetical protein